MVRMRSSVQSRQMAPNIKTPLGEFLYLEPSEQVPLRHLRSGLKTRIYFLLFLYAKNLSVGQEVLVSVSELELDVNPLVLMSLET